MVLQICLTCWALWASGLGNYLVRKGFAIETILWLLGFVIQINLEHEPIALTDYGYYSYATQFNGFTLILNYMKQLKWIILENYWLIL